MNDATRRRRERVCVLVVATLLAAGLFAAVPAGSTYSYCDRAMQVVNGYMQPVASAVVKLESSAVPGVIVASPTTGSDGTWCAALPASGNYDVTVGTGAKQAGQFFCLADLLPTPTPTATVTPTPTVTSTP